MIGQGQVLFSAPPGGVKKYTLTKGGTTTIVAAAGHNIALHSFLMAAVMSADVANRVFSVYIYDASGGNIITRLFQGTLTASLSKTLQGGLGLPATYPAVDDSVLFPSNGLIIPPLGQLAINWTALEAADTWTAYVYGFDYVVDPLL